MKSFRQFLLNEASFEQTSQTSDDETRAILDQIEKMDAEREARENKVDPKTGLTYRERTNQLVQQGLDRQRSIENYDNVAETMPALAARMRFNSQSRARSASPYGTSGQSDMDSLATLSPEEQASVVATQSNARLKAMLKAQYDTSSNNVSQGRNQKLGASKVSAINAIYRQIADRRDNAMGGKAVAASYVRSWQADPTSERTQQSMAVRTPQERLAMLDAMDVEAKRQFRENGKLDPNFVKMMNQFNNSRSY